MVCGFGATLTLPALLISLGVHHSHAVDTRSPRSAHKRPARLGASLSQTLNSHNVSKAPSPAAAPAGAPAPETGMCGCPLVPTDQCTCDASLLYLKCVDAQCRTGKCACPDSPFHQECTALSGSCGSELEFTGCGSSTVSCQGLFNQASDSTAGFTIDTRHLGDEAYCGPYGRCTGKVHVFADAYRTSPGTRLQCTLSGKVCDGEFVDGVAECTLPMVDRLESGKELEGQCFMMQGETKVSKESWFRVWNRYAGPPVASAATEDKDMKVSVDTKEEVAKRKVEKSTPKKKKAEPAPAAVSVGGDAASPAKKMQKEYYMNNIGQPVNKLLIALISGLGLGAFGLDRCFMGQRWMGCIKLVTLGGCGIWSCVDWVVLTINCLMFWSSINAVGFRAVWMKDTITPAFWVTILIFAVKFVISPIIHKKVTSSKQQEEP